MSLLIRQLSTGVPTSAMTLVKVNPPRATGGAYFIGDTVQVNCSQPANRGNPLALTYALYRASDGATVVSNDNAKTAFSMVVSSLAYNSSYSCLARNALGQSPTTNLVPVLVLGECVSLYLMYRVYNEICL